MDKYINAELLKQSILTDFYEHFSRNPDSEQAALVEMVVQDIDEQPAADVEPVKHGKWIGEIYPHCSVCWQMSDYYCDGTHECSKFCPNCGARMKGV